MTIGEGSEDPQPPAIPGVSVPVGTHEEEEEEEDSGEAVRKALLPPSFEEEFLTGPDGEVRQFTARVPTGIDPAYGPGGVLSGSRKFGEGITFTEQPARYFENDQALLWTRTGSVNPSILSPESVAAYQRNMVAAGILSEGDYSAGVWDKKTVDANRELLRTANVTGRDAYTTLALLARGVARLKEDEDSRNGGRGSLPPTVRLSNRDELKATFKEVARRQTGGVFLDDDQVESMVNSFQEKEAAYQRSVAKGGTVEAAPSAQTFAAGTIEQIDEGGATANRFAEMTSVLGGLLQ